MISPAPQIAVDNDVVLKASSYGLPAVFWPEGGRGIGVLAAARFVVASHIARGRGRDKAAAAQHLKELLSVALALEPTAEEVEIALQIERAAQRKRLPLDAGESQLSAIVVMRAMASLQTGDKRAIDSLEPLLEDVANLAYLCGRVRSLEQVVLDSLDNVGFETISNAICAEPDIDKALSICFGCYGVRATHTGTANHLHMYISELRAKAPRVLAAR